MGSSLFPGDSPITTKGASGLPLAPTVMVRIGQLAHLGGGFAFLTSLALVGW